MNEDDEVLLDHVALECMHAIEMKDKDKFVESLHVLVADLLSKLEMNEDEGEE